jgi:hypothetical protein
LPQITTLKNGKLHDNKMKGLLRILELSKNEQRVVLITILVLIAIAFVRYERRVHPPSVQTIAEVEAKPSPTPMEAKDER